jgi:hypothetical protein
MIFRIFPVYRSEKNILFNIPYTKFDTNWFDVICTTCGRQYCCGKYKTLSIDLHLTMVMTLAFALDFSKKKVQVIIKDVFHFVTNLNRLSRIVDVLPLNSKISWINSDWGKIVGARQLDCRNNNY